MYILAVMLWCIPTVSDVLVATKCTLDMVCTNLVCEYCAPGPDEFVSFLNHLMGNINVAAAQAEYITDDIQIEFFSSDALRTIDTEWCNKSVSYMTDVHVWIKSLWLGKTCCAIFNDCTRQWATHVCIRECDRVTMWTCMERICQELHSIHHHFPSWSTVEFHNVHGTIQCVVQTEMITV
jgi:hypothetical protein